MSTFDTTHHTPDASIWPSAVKWGLLSGIVGAGLTMLFYNLGMSEPGNTSGAAISFILTLGISFVFVFLGIKSYRENNNAGQLSLGRGVFWSLGLGLIAGLFTMVFSYFFFTYLAPDIITSGLELQLATMEEQGMGEDELESTASFMSIFMTPISFAISGLLMGITFSVIQGLISSLILKTR